MNEETTLSAMEQRIMDRFLELEPVLLKEALDMKEEMHAKYGPIDIGVGFRITPTLEEIQSGVLALAGFPIDGAFWCPTAERFVRIETRFWKRHPFTNGSKDKGETERRILVIPEH